jgi:predicted LPLAT superfamily acyltransferase
MRLLRPRERFGLQTDWKTQAERSNTLALRIIVWIALKLGRRVARLVLLPITLYFWATSPKARLSSNQYLRRVEKFSGRPANSLSSLKHIHAFASTLLDRVYMLTGQTKYFDTRTENFFQMKKVHNQKVGGIFVGAHIGSFEALRVLGTRDPNTHELLPDLTVRMAMYAENARKITTMLEAISPDSGKFIISLGHPDAMLQIQSTIDKGEFVGMLADRHLDKTGCESISFLGESALFPTGPFRLAMVLKRPVYLMFGLYYGANRYEVHFDELALPPMPLTGGRAAQLRLWQTDYVKKLEEFCSKAPYCWFNFFDFWVDE